MADFNETYLKLKSIRDREDLSLRLNPFLKETFVGFDGKERPFKFRYYQIQGILHLLTMKRFILGDDTGLGKTIMTIGSLTYLWEKNPDQKVIIFTTKSAVEQWVGEFEKFTSGITTFICKGTPAKRRKVYDQFMASEGPTAMVMGYRSAVNDFEYMQDWEGLIYVFDEATAFKNPKTQVHQLCKYLAAPERAERVWGLTATLIKNNLMEGYGIYQVVQPDVFPYNAQKFMMKYCITRLQRLPGSRRKIPVIVGYRDKDIETFRDEIDPYFLGRPKFKVAKELPALTIKEVKVGMSKQQELKYAEALSGVLEVGKGTEVEEKETTKLTALIYCQQIVDHLELIDCEGPSEKLNVLLEMLTEGGEFHGQKIILFSRFRKLVDHVIPILKKKKIECVRVTGSDSGDERKEAMRLFQDPNSGVNTIFITGAGAEGINLQAANAMIFYDSPWSAGDYLQLLGRMIRIGSVHDKVYALHLVTRGTIDGHVMSTLKRKMKLLESVIGRRIKGDDDSNFEISAANEISDLFLAVQKDALKQTGKV